MIKQNIEREDMNMHMLYPKSRSHFGRNLKFVCHYVGMEGPK